MLITRNFGRHGAHSCRIVIKKRQEDLSRIVYLLGAGASFGRRGEKQLDFRTERLTKDGVISGGGSCVNIVSGVPVVNEIPGRLAYMIHSLVALSNKPQNGLDNNKLQKLIDDLVWLQDMTSRHATIDTFAKKLFLTGNHGDYQKLKNLLLIFLFFEQIINEPDQRYDTFLASILQNDVNHLPEDIAVVSWNYDFQFELAYNEYVKADNLSMLSEIFLHSHDKLSERRGGEPYHGHKGFNLLKLNGSAFVAGDNSYYDIKKGQNLASMLEMYSKLDVQRNRISFAWERMNDQYVQRISDCVSDAKVLVIIGYSFPFFNREVDRIIFEKMPSLEKIYIQDPNASTVKMSLQPVLSSVQVSVNHLDRYIVTLEADPKQFFMPPEL